MEKYIEGNKAAGEEAFDNRDASRGADITGANTECIRSKQRAIH